MNKLFNLLVMFSLLGLPSQAPAAATPPLLELIPIVSGLSQPLGITQPHDQSGRLFITLQDGRIMIFDGAQLLLTPFLNVSGLISCCGERGLLGLAFHPNYKNNGFFYLDYTRSSDGATVIARYSVSADSNVANPASASILLVIPQDQANHNGGQLQFGPDGYLYIGMGDGGGGGDPLNRAQDPASLLGKILRIDVDSGSPYGIPPGNPFVGDAGTRPEIWAFGTRNPWRFSFDRLTGDLFIGDVGQGAWEEIDFQPAGSAGGQNYGWSCFEGLHPYDNTRNCTQKGTLTSPILEYDHSLGCSVIGGYRYTGSSYPALRGLYLYADFCTGRIWGAAQNGASWTSGQLLDTTDQFAAFGEDEAGELYLAAYGGTIYKVAATSFGDVPTSYWAWSWIERLYYNGITSGCGTNPLRFCPMGGVTRDQMAVFLLKAEHGSGYRPPAASGVFQDVPASFWAAAWIEQLYAEGVTTGCSASPLLYCPSGSVTRDQMAVFLLKAKHGGAYLPPAASGVFADVPISYWAAAWIEQLRSEGITSGCSSSPLQYCPMQAVPRDQMAVLLSRAFNLPAYVP